jgi:hypothetical protein
MNSVVRSTSNSTSRRLSAAGLDQTSADGTGRLTLRQRQPSFGQCLRHVARGIPVEHGADLAVQRSPLGRRPVGVVVLPLLPRRFTEVLPHRVDILHVHGGDDSLKNRGLRRIVSLDGVLCLRQRVDGAVEGTALRFEHFALLTEHRPQRQRIALEDGADLFQRDAERLESDDLLQSRQVRRGIGAIAGRRSCRLQQAEPVVVMQRLDGDAGERGELVNAV